MSYAELPISFDTITIADNATKYLIANIPAWRPAEGHLEVWLIEALARLTREASVIAANMPSEAFREFGAQFLDLERLTGAESKILTEWVLQDDSGWFIPAGTLAGFRQSGNSVIPFEVTADVDVPVGTGVVNILLRARDSGSDTNGVPPGTMELIDSLTYIDSVVAIEASAGGRDPETDEEYQDRLHTEMLLLTPRPILPRDFAILAERVDGVTRALPLNLYNPDDGTFDNERYLTLCLLDPAGQPCTTPVKDAAMAYIDSLREINFIVRVTDATYTLIDVEFTVKVRDGANEELTVAAAKQAVTQWLDPANFAGGDEHPPAWHVGYDTIRYLQMVKVIGDTDGVEYVKSLTINGAYTDVPLAGVAPLPGLNTLIGNHGVDQGTTTIGHATSRTSTTATATSVGIVTYTGDAISVISHHAISSGTFTPLGVAGGLFGGGGANIADGGFASQLTSRNVSMASTWDDSADAQLHQYTPSGEFGHWNKVLDLAVGGIYKSTGDTWAAAASGSYDSRWTTALNAVASAWGTRDKSLLYLRFAHEMNGSFSTNWSVSSSEVANYITAFRRFVGLQRSIVPGSHVVWPLNDGSSMGFDFRSAYPGGSYVDVIGVDSYNQYPFVNNTTQWNSKIVSTDGYGTPVGIEAWRQWALSQGKPMCLPEWGNNGDTSASGGGGESVFYVQTFHDWCVAHAGTGAGQIIYASVFNLYTQFQLYPTTIQPLTWQRYKEIF